jgi:hypothetical protein
MNDATLPGLPPDALDSITLVSVREMNMLG